MSKWDDYHYRTKDELVALVIKHHRLASERGDTIDMLRRKLKRCKLQQSSDDGYKAPYIRMARRLYEQQRELEQYKTFAFVTVLSDNERKMIRNLLGVDNVLKELPNLIK